MKRTVEKRNGRKDGNEVEQVVREICEDLFDGHPCHLEHPDNPSGWGSCPG